MNLVAYNMRLGGSEAHWRALHGAFQPDIILAQESLPPPSAPTGSPERTLWQPVPGHRWGSAVYVRSGALTPVAVPGYEGWAVAADLYGIAPGPLRLASIHVPAGRGGYVSVANRILDRLAGSAGPATALIGGDFNLTIGRRHAGEARQNKRAQLQLLDRLEHEFGVVSAWQIANPDRPLAQTLRWTGDPTTPYHCDAVFVPIAWTNAIAEAQVVSGGDWDRRSDHNPLVVRLNGGLDALARDDVAREAAGRE